MQLSDVIIVALITNIVPVILVLVQRLLTPKQDLGKMIEEIKQSLETYKIEQASLALTQKNWEIIKTKDVTNFSYQEWLMLYNNLTKLVPEGQWGEPLLSETIKARKILQGE
jgi:hypothetical protein